MRYFISIDVEDEGVKNSLMNFTGRIDNLGDTKVVDPQNLHLTLLYLGERPKSEVPEIKDSFVDAMADVDVGEFECMLSDLGVFPHMNYIKTVWAGAETDGKIRDIHMKLNEHIHSENEHDFTPHVTLARVKGIEPGEKQRMREEIESYPADFGSFSVENVRLKQSKLTPEGPIYRDLEVVEL
ncbi:MAG: RNA 2',3'-cyclic phosphodiesterase [Candidatus Nanohaloarchaeota archaeon QJJ-7]|nr:RNA 2',3'-cyclic phosphodiesterase [Candidatus Nanohaloarchaeota archaeon QJJ-7]